VVVVVVVLLPAAIAAESKSVTASAVVRQTSPRGPYVIPSTAASFDVDEPSEELKSLTGDESRIWWT
jgi:hypothetical protein